jgi:hypothetical protein
MFRDAMNTYEYQHKIWECTSPSARGPEPQPPQGVNISAANGATGKFALARAQEAAEKQRIYEQTRAMNHRVAVTYESHRYASGRSDVLNLRDYDGHDDSVVQLRDRSATPARDRNRFDHGVVALTSTGIDPQTARDMVLRADPSAADDHRAVPERNDGSATRRWESLVSDEYRRQREDKVARGVRPGPYDYADAANTVALRNPDAYRAYRMEQRDLDDIGG